MDAGAAQLSTFDALTTAFASAADPARAEPMAKYMKDHFVFFGIPTPARRAIQREVFGRSKPDEAELIAFVDACWARPERELQYVACDLLLRRARHGSVGPVSSLPPRGIPPASRRVGGPVDRSGSTALTLSCGIQYPPRVLTAKR